jgi:hypothetical protein
MWSCDEFIAKAKLYFRRASEHDRVDEEFSIWLLLGLEFILRAPLARANPVLLAIPEGPSILHAAGFDVPNSTPKSVPYKTVCDRLKTVVPDFAEAYDDALFLANVRNEELHTSTATLASLDNAVWMPKFLRVMEVLAKHLQVDLEDFIDPAVIEHARALADAEDAKLKRAIGQKIKDAKSFFERLLPSEVEKRRPVYNVLDFGLFQEVDCPACGVRARVNMKRVRSTRERLEEDSIFTEEVRVGTDYECAVCGLTLAGVPELRAASLPTEQIFSWESFASDRFSPDQFDGFEYGND